MRHRQQHGAPSGQASRLKLWRRNRRLPREERGESSAGAWGQASAHLRPLGDVGGGARIQECSADVRLPFGGQGLPLEPSARVRLPSLSVSCLCDEGVIVGSMPVRA